MYLDLTLPLTRSIGSPRVDKSYNLLCALGRYLVMVWGID